MLRVPDVVQRLFWGLGHMRASLMTTLQALFMPRIRTKVPSPSVI